PALPGDFSQVGHHPMFDTSPHGTATQQEGVDSESLCVSQKQDYPDEPVIAETVLNVDHEALHSPGLTKSVQLRFRAPDRGKIKLVGPLGELGYPRQQTRRKRQNLDLQP